MIEPLACERGIGMTFPTFEPPGYLLADQKRVKQVMINLLSNAIKYNKAQGAVTVEYALSPPGAICISVRNTGEGLAPENLAQLFQPFNRLGQEVGPEYGTGIGLVMSKRLVALMGGAIGVDSMVGVGSMFWIELKWSSTSQAERQ
jgi:signal transduction histidine kinase